MPVWIIAIAPFVLVAVGGISIGIARPWLEERGYLFRKGEQGSVSSAALSFGAVFKPEIEHIIEAEQAAEVASVDDESGEPPVAALD